MEDEGFGEKHLEVDQRRKRFDPKSRYGGRGGASLVKARNAGDITLEGYTRIYLDVERPRDDEGHILVSKLDQDIPGLASGNELPVDLAVKLPDLLDEICLAKKTDRSKDQVVITTYTVPGVAWLAPSREEQQLLEQRRAARLTLMTESGVEGRLKPFCKIRDAPLERIMDVSLLDNNARLIGRNCANGDSSSARVFAENVHSCFTALENDKESFLEVDLGADCEVTYISTQGRFPAMAYTDKATGTRVIAENSQWLNQWVTAYEFSYRAAGKDWVAMGEFKGNFDMTTEVAHELPSGQRLLTCRYLRFRPLTYNRAPAMRVGVYGRRLSSKEGPVRTDAANEDTLIRFTIHRIKENINARRVPVGSSCRSGCARCSKYRGMCRGSFDTTSKARRLRLREGTVQEVRLLAGDAPAGRLLSVAEDEVDALGDEGAGDETVPPPPPPPPQPRLARQRSNSNPDLLSAAASTAGSTLGDSVEVVQEPDIEHYEDWEWLCA